MLFVSKYAQHRIILRPTDVVVDQHTRKRQVIRGLTCEFAMHRYQTKDREIIQGLLEVPEYGHTFSVALNDKELIDYRTKHGCMPPNAADILLEMEAKQTGIPVTPPPMVLKDEKEAATTPVAEGAVAEKPEVVGTQTPVDSEKIQEMIDKTVGKAMNDILAAIKGTAEAKPMVDATRRRKTFHCKVCGEEFKTGMDVGRHKKEAHPEVQGTTEAE